MGSEWTALPFREYLSEPVSNGVYKAKEFHGLGAKVVNMGELFANPRLFAVPMKRVILTEREMSRSLLAEGDLLFARRSLTAAGAGKCSVVLKVDGPTTFESSIIRARLDRTKANSLYFYYLFSSQLGSELMRSILRQVAVSGITGSDLSALVISAPAVGEQEKIAEMLGMLDHRIELLSASNRALEAIARAMFKSWFVDFDPVRAKAEGREPEGMDAATAALFPSEFQESEFGSIPKGWHQGILGQVCKVARTVVQRFAMNADENYVGLEYIPRESWALSSWGTAEDLQSGKSRFQHGDILFGKLRPYFHKVCIAPVDGLCSTDILVLRADPIWTPFVLCHASSRVLIEYATRLSNGAKMPRTRWQDLHSYKIAIPPSELAEVFASIVQPMIDKIKANVHASRTLAELRDTLLPRLISGKLRVPEAEKVMEAVV